MFTLFMWGVLIYLIIKYRENIKFYFKNMKYDKFGFDKRGFNILGKHKDTNTFYDKDGYDKDGYDIKGFDKNGRHKDTKTKYNKLGYDKYGFNKKKIHCITHTHLNPRGFNYEGIHYKTKQKYDEFGMDINGKLIKNMKYTNIKNRNISNIKNIQNIQKQKLKKNKKNSNSSTLLSYFNNRIIFLDTNILLDEQTTILFDFIKQNKLKVEILGAVYDEVTNLKKQPKKRKLASLANRRIIELQHMNLIRILNIKIQAEKKPYADPKIISKFAKLEIKNSLLITRDQDVTIRTNEFININNNKKLNNKVVYIEFILDELNKYKKVNKSLKISSLSNKNVKSGL